MGNALCGREPNRTAKSDGDAKPGAVRIMLRPRLHSHV